MKNKCTRMESVQFRVQFGSLIAPIIARTRFQVQFCEQLGQSIARLIAHAQFPGAFTFSIVQSEVRWVTQSRPNLNQKEDGS